MTNSELSGYLENVALSKRLMGYTSALHESMV